jgi:hypothetical protein
MPSSPLVKSQKWRVRLSAVSVLSAFVASRHDSEALGNHFAHTVNVFVSRFNAERDASVRGEVLKATCELLAVSVVDDAAATTAPSSSPRGPLSSVSAALLGAPPTLKRQRTVRLASFLSANN